MNWLRRFMTGRYGADELSIALIFGNLLFWLIGILTGWWIFSLISTIFAVLFCCRVLSKKIPVRQQENRAFLKVWNPIYHRFQQWRSRLQDRSHRYVRCKHCRERLRLPRGKGRIEVTCPKCRERFIIKT